MSLAAPVQRNSDAQTSFMLSYVQAFSPVPEASDCDTPARRNPRLLSSAQQWLTTVEDFGQL